MLFLCFSTLCSADNYIDAKPAEKVKIRHHHVVLYATSWCGYCKKTRAFLAENNIQYTEYDIETSTHGRDEHRALGGSGVPVMVIKGDVVHGYNTRKMRKIFEALDLM
ncbi:MAG: glutaredoxin family protein [Methylophilaceae bacterium]|nr:glutaredoxin family protein [Methylophilaceae bacterium]MDG1820303.1 glutaredoxin family protein [Methylophilaceae bacterium]MDG2292951.1 glutaredoxin family protein [Methylophilaceae bacterium]